MRIVHKDGGEPLNFPGVCVFTRDAEGPFLDTETWLNARDIGGVDPYGYIHVQKVKDMGRAVGMVPQEELDAAEERISELEAELELLRETGGVRSLIHEATEGAFTVDEDGKVVPSEGAFAR